MTLFATEFPVRPLQHASSFVGQVVEWLRGTEYSTVLDGNKELDGETAHLLGANGEELHLRQLNFNAALQAIGFRHDYPDDRGCLWRTEAVLRQASEAAPALVRLRTQCIAQHTNAWLQTPRKPYLVKTLLRDCWGAADGTFPVTDQPVWLNDDDNGLEIACDITMGNASRHLPVVYLSAVGASIWLIDPQSIKKLAYDLGGIAHVVAEPARHFSFALRDATQGRNVYGGTIGIALPSRGLVRRLYLDWRLPDPKSLVAELRSSATALRSQMPAMGWDWTELQERALRDVRARERNRLSARESEQLYLDEIQNLQDRVSQLEEQLATRPQAAAAEHDYDLIPQELVERLGPEVYPGEFSDRLLLAASMVCQTNRSTEIDKRSRAVLERFLAVVSPSPAKSELLEDLRRATKDPKRLAASVAKLLERHGYCEKSDNKHIRLEAAEGYFGLDSITLPKTPSDRRGLLNLRKQIEHALGV